jgi:hypothetical protein
MAVFTRGQREGIWQGFIPHNIDKEGKVIVERLMSCLTRGVNGYHSAEFHL